MAFNPAAADQTIQQERQALEEVDAQDIARDTLIDVCDEILEANDPRRDQLITDVQTLYDMAEKIEQETLGHPSDHHGRKLVREASQRSGEQLFAILLEECEQQDQNDQGKEDDR